MSKSKLFLFFLILQMIQFGCRDKEVINTDVLVPEIMVSIIVEIELTQAAFKVENQDEKFNLDKLTNTIFEKHQTTKDKFQESLSFYASKPLQMEEIYNKVINEISSKQASLKSK